MEAAELDPDVIAVLVTLDRHGVEYIVAGDVAHAVQGGARFVDTVAIVPSGYARNVDRLGAALASMGAELRIAGEGQLLPVDLSAASLRAIGHCVLATDHADVEIDFEPAGTAGYPDLYLDARAVPVGGGSAPQIASPEDLHRMAAGGVSITPSHPASAH
jgi:hypothetical protein